MENKKFDTVQMVRNIRDTMEEEHGNKTGAERVEILRKKSAKSSLRKLLKPVEKQV
jgi:hypothetical protein